MEVSHRHIYPAQMMQQSLSMLGLNTLLRPSALAFDLHKVKGATRSLSQGVCASW
jgi:hypothetical protein